jgi:hypothetical protein
MSFAHAIREVSWEGGDGGPELVIRGEHPWLALRRQGHPWPLPPLAVGAKAEVWLDRHASLRLADAGASAAAARVRLMEAAGLAEPYRRLTEKPDRVSQWCSKHWLKAGDRKGGGKRRRAS